ncbi:exo-alpha-sialidase [soil metagenome]
MDAGVVCGRTGEIMFIFDKAPFPSSHASTLVEVTPGHLMAAWFGGTGEGKKDVQIWASDFDGTKWTPPQVLGSENGQPCWNPVLFVTPKNDLVLWYKTGPSPQQWTGYVRRSRDKGKTWSTPQALPASFFGPVRAKPFALKDDTILAPTSVESHRVWTPFVDRSNDDGVTWLRSNDFGVKDKPGQIQPTIFESKPGTLVALMRSKDPKFICRSVSTDNGVTWSIAQPTTLPNNNAGIDVVTAKDGAVWLIHNPVAIGRFPLRLSKSVDGGATWEKVTDLETEAGEFSYPALIAGSDGKLHMTYTWNRTHIKYVVQPV